MTPEKLGQKLAEKEEQYLRMLAEYYTFRERTQKEREGLYSAAVVSTAAHFLPVLDTLERALANPCQNAECHKGSEMTAKQFSDILEKLGVKPAGEVGETFDPEKHNAIMHIEDENFGECEICAVLLRGYICGDRVVRHALVKVAN